VPSPAVSWYRIPPVRAPAALFEMIQSQAQLPLALFDFRTPAFAAAGAALIAIPIIIHLLNRRRFKTVTWAAMEFLLRAMRKKSSAAEVRAMASPRGALPAHLPARLGARPTPWMRKRGAGAIRPAYRPQCLHHR